MIHLSIMIPGHRTHCLLNLRQTYNISSGPLILSARRVTCLIRILENTILASPTTVVHGALCQHTPGVDASCTRLREFADIHGLYRERNSHSRGLHEIRMHVCVMEYV